jgi:hypothetical protein
LITLVSDVVEPTSAYPPISVRPYVHSMRLMEDGVDYTVKGLEDATTYPHLIAEMISRDWSDSEIIGLMGGNLMRVMDDVDRVAKEMEEAGMKPSPAILEDRLDLPMEKDHELPLVVSKYLREKTKEGTLRAGLREIK